MSVHCHKIELNQKIQQKFTNNLNTGKMIPRSHILLVEGEQQDLLPDRIAHLSAPCPSNKIFNVKTLTF